MSRSKLVLATWLIFAGLIYGQQANTANASLTLNDQNHPVGSTGPIAINVSPGGAFQLRISGLPFQRFLLAGSTVTAPGTMIAPYGILDITFPFETIFDGFVPVNIFDFFALTNSSGQYVLSGALSPSFPSLPLGIQAAVADPSAPGGGRLTAALSITTIPLVTQTTTYPQTMLGDDVTVTYYHQALQFPFYGNVYGRTNIDTNGYLSFGPPTASEWLAGTPQFLAGPPRVAPYWSDLHMSTLVASAFGFISVAPASIVVTESNNGSVVSLQVDWLFATEAAVPPGTGMMTPGTRLDFRTTIDSTGRINMIYGPNIGPGAMMTGTGQVISVVGIGPGGGLSPAVASRDLVVNGSVTPFTAATAGDAIFETLNPPFGVDFLNLTMGMNFMPMGTVPPLSQTYMVN